MKKNNNLLIAIAIIVAAIIIAPNLNFSFTSINQETINQLENAVEGTCSVSLNRNVITEGDLITGTVKDGAVTLCSIYGNLDNTGWIKIGEGVTDSYGEIEITDTLNIPGTFAFRAICGDCVTNTANLLVNPLIPSTCTDTDGINKLTAGWVISDGVTYYDECVSDVVTEYYCNGDVVDTRILPCDAGYECLFSRSGAYCFPIDDGLQPGDEVGSWEENHLISNSDTSFEMVLTPGDDEVQLCAEIERSSYKVSPMCNALPSQLEDWAEFVFLDSTGVVWDRSDQITAGKEGGPDTFGNPDVLHVYWDGQTNFKGYMSHYGPCPMNMNMKVTLVVCE